MRLPFRSLLTVLGVLCGLSSVVANAQLPVPAGSRVRVTAPQLVVPVVGSFQTIRTDTLVVLEEGPSASIWAVPLSTVQKLELSGGVQMGDAGRATKFALFGGVGGALLGLAASAILQSSTGDRYNKASSAAVGAGVGALAAGLLGYRHPHETWTAVSLSRRPAPGR